VRVILDANVLISFLLTTEEQRTVTQVVRACFQRPDIQVVMPIELLGELQSKVATKPYLAERIATAQLVSLIHALRAAAEVPPPLSEALPTFTRDRKDDYLIAYALLYGVDYLVTGDPDLLLLGQVENVRVVSPAGFLRLALSV
jgi:putative PIN family toxin of toxin-antitoxin system